MATYLGKQKIGVIVPIEFGGKYSTESIKLEDGTQHLKITTVIDESKVSENNIDIMEIMGLVPTISEGGLPLDRDEYVLAERHFQVLANRIMYGGING